MPAARPSHAGLRAGRRARRRARARRPGRPPGRQAAEPAGCGGAARRPPASPPPSATSPAAPAPRWRLRSRRRPSLPPVLALPRPVSGSRVGMSRTRAVQPLLPREHDRSRNRAARLSGSPADVAPDVRDRHVALVRELENVRALRLGDLQFERRQQQRPVRARQIFELDHRRNPERASVVCLCPRAAALRTRHARLDLPLATDPKAGATARAVGLSHSAIDPSPARLSAC